MRGVDGAAVGKLGTDAGDRGPFVREGRVGGNKVSSRADCQPATGQIYTDPTGRSLVPSVSGNSYILVVYDYDSNLIHAEPMRNRTKVVILAAYQRALSLLKSRGLQPELQKLDNEASQVLQQYMVEEHINF